MSVLKQGRESVLEDDSFNLTPLIDCVFLLLIFFMVTTVFKNPAALQIALPVVNNPSELEKRQLIAELDGNGNVALNSIAASFDSFEAFLVNEKQKTGNNTLLIKADENASHGDVLKIMKMARSVEIEQIAIAVDKQSEE